jgi:hypothetical protein
MLLGLAQRGAFREHGWMRGEMPAKTPHHFAVEYDDEAVVRIIAKIAYGVCFQGTGSEIMSSEPFTPIRRFILGLEHLTPVVEISAPGTITSYPDHHLTAVHLRHGRVAGTVVLYGGCHSVDLGPVFTGASAVLPLAAMSRRDGTDSRVIEGEMMRRIVDALTAHATDDPGQ